MRINLLFVFLFLAYYSGAQVDTSKVYSIAEKMPLIPQCAALDTTDAAKKKCTQDLLLSFIYRNVQYPDSARLAGLEGTVVVSFVIGRDSMVKDAQILRDIGGGCGLATTYVINAMNPLNLRWVPGELQGVPIDVRMTIPVKFKLQEPPPYMMVDRDTVYTEMDKALAYKGGPEALDQYLKQNLMYPASGNDSCSIGVIEATALVTPKGEVRILEINDFSNLGMDFQFEAISTVTSTMGQWEFAEYKGRAVPTSYPIRMNFYPTAASCQTTISNFETAQQLAIEGSNLFNQESQEEGIAKLDEAIQLFPNNAEYLYARGQAHMELQNMAQACEDLTKVKEILLVGWVDNLLPIICNVKEVTNPEETTSGNE